MRYKSCIYLTADHALSQSDQVGLTPRALAPGRDLAQVLVKIKLRQLVVDEVSDVPRQVIVTVDQRHLGKNLPNGFQSFARRRQERELPIGRTWPDFAHPGANRQYDHGCCPYTTLAATLQQNTAMDRCSSFCV